MLHLQICLMITAGKQMIVMITVIHLFQEIIRMNVHHHGNMMCPDMIVNRMEGLYM